MEAIGRWALEHGIWVVTDEIYEHLLYDGARAPSMPVVVPELADTCVVLNGVATAMYIGAQLGPGPRDGLMTGLAKRTGRSIRLVRTSIEITVVAVGWLLGGVLGLGTIAYALLIGPITQALLPFFIVRLDVNPLITTETARF